MMMFHLMFHNIEQLLLVSWERHVAFQRHDSMLDALVAYVNLAKHLLVWIKLEFQEKTESARL